MNLSYRSIYKTRVDKYMYYIFATEVNILQIPILADLPVGENLMDHITTDISFLVNDTISITPSEISSLKAYLEYELFGQGNVVQKHIFLAFTIG